MVMKGIRLVIDFLMIVDLIIIFVTGYAGRASVELHILLSWILVVLLVIHHLFNFKMIKGMLNNWGRD